MQDNTISSEELACVGIHCTHGMRQKGETAMKVTSTKKDLMLYGAMTILFAVGSILYIDLHGFTKIYYLLCLIALFLLGVLFFVEALRFRITWGLDGFTVRHGLAPEKRYAHEQFQHMHVEHQCVILVLGGKKYTFSQGCPHATEFIDFLEETYGDTQE